MDKVFILTLSAVAVAHHLQEELKLVSVKIKISNGSRISIQFLTKAFCIDYLHL